VEDLVGAIHAYLDAHNNDPTPFVWTARACDILEKVKRARATLNTDFRGPRTVTVV
jgi:hypothetical protein